MVALLDGGVSSIHVVVGALQGNQTSEFLDRLSGIVYAEIEYLVGPRLARRLRLYDYDGCGLASADIAADCLSRFESCQHTLRQIAFRLLVRFRHGGPDLVVRHEVSLR